MHARMGLSEGTLLFTLCAGVVLGLAVLHTAAVRYLHEVHVHELRVEANRLRAEYQRRLDALRRRTEAEIQVIDPGLPQSEAGLDPGGSLPLARAS